MPTEKTYKKINAILLAENENDSIIYRLYENNIFHVIVKEGEKVNMEMVNEGYAFLENY